MAWLRWYEGASTDTKFHFIARRCSQPVAFVIAVWAMLLERASAASDRGKIEGFDCESADAALGMPDGTTQTIFDAMVAKGMIVGARIAKWEERQPKREDATSTERVREHRARQKAKSEIKSNEAERNETPCNAVKQNETQCNEAERNETLDKSRIDKSIKDSIKNPPYPPEGEEGEKEISPDEVSGESASIEFQELRQFYDAEMRPEGPMAGWKEYKQAKSGGYWPGVSRIVQDIEERKKAGVWNPGYEIGLGRYLSERTWLAPVKARASPKQPVAKTEFQQNRQNSRLMAGALLADRRKNRGAQNDGKVIETTCRNGGCLPDGAGS